MTKVFKPAFFLGQTHNLTKKLITIPTEDRTHNKAKSTIMPPAKKRKNNICFTHQGHV